ncbi:hypothetical protein RJ641_030628 [Dillenia turbinata]|uniref:CP12 domain-containing protein n=1 Tax=Dillenia turbinata TaxID=194707 RepID=A0AAN8W8D1_9MAGN
MATAIAGVNITSPRIVAKATDSPKAIKFSTVTQPWKRTAQFRAARLRVAAAPDQLSEKVAESVKNAEEACAGDPASGECVAAWDEVEELSAAASHARDRKKDTDALETYCKDNPEADECRTYDN